MVSGFVVSHRTWYTRYSNVQLFVDVVARSMKDMLGARTIVGARSSLRGAEALEFWIFEAPRFVVGFKT